MLPTTIWMVVTYRCNDRCKGCYAAAECFSTQRLSSSLGGDIPLLYAKEVMAELRNCGAKSCLLIGGEPTLYSNLLQLIEYGTSLGLKMKLVSNGRRLANRPYVKKLQQAGLAHASVSIEAASVDLHDRITGTHGFYQRIAGLNNLVEAGISNNSILTISVNNAEEVVPVAEKMYQMKVQNILYNFCLPAITENGKISSEASFDPQLAADIISKAYWRLKDLGISFGFFATIPLCLIETKTREAMMRDQMIAKNRHCHIFYGTGVVFEPNGNVLPCTHFVGMPLFNAMNDLQGFIYKNRFAQEWEEGSHGDFLKACWKYPSPECRTCHLWGVCVGGCPFQWTYFKPEKFIRGL